MVSFRTICYPHLYQLLKHQNPSQFVRNPSYSSSVFRPNFSDVQDVFFTTSLIFQRKFSASAQLVPANEIEEGESACLENNASIKELGENKENKGEKDLDVIVKGGVGLSEKFEENGSSKEESEEGEVSIGSSLKEIKELKQKLEKLEREVRSMKGNGDRGEQKKEKLGREVRKMKGNVERTEKKKENLEREVRSMKGGIGGTMGKKKKKEEVSKNEEGFPTIQSKPSSLHALFASKPNSLNSMFLKNSSDVKKPVVSKLENNNSIDIKKTAVSKQERVSKTVRSKPLKVNRPIKKELSSEMVSLMTRWHEEGYLNNAKVSETKEMDASSNSNSSETKEMDVSSGHNHLETKEIDASPNFNQYRRDFLRFTAERFGQDHQEIAKWLSGSDLKTVALFGCPSLEKNSAFAAKRLRSFFRIQEDVVCRSCVLKSSCKLVNKRVWEGTDNLKLADVMRVLSSYELDLVDTQLAVPSEVEVSISKLLKEVVNLSQ